MGWVMKAAMASMPTAKVWRRKPTTGQASWFPNAAPRICGEANTAYSPQKQQELCFLPVCVLLQLIKAPGKEYLHTEDITS